ncbi:D-alanyl-D-alanine carboxypeptidase [Streptomyces sp. CA-210063]|uniref:D-alanyl-D-alanine carboxypeptidase n=1 Tax=Streptomyces sp. CA-210063 TaxID=2801029 RepID=UPI00214B92D0|nr:D-alanyl-D-alanine carboxypeptidase [Streptomyces sp. CA-210063]UUU33197.1 D-alanyl-D-alanine carboxypeptidase [Streptomyces sp. CA-210063]
MAGTSPDRSKRYESSTGSTSGSEAPIPDAPAPGATGSLPGQSSGSTEPTPDPRISMSREPAPKVDQATAVFSRRALLEATETAEASKASKAEALRPTGAEDADGVGTEGARAKGSGAERAGTAGPGTGEAGSAEPGTVGSLTGKSGAAGAGTGKSGAAGAGTGKSEAAGPGTGESETGRGDAADGEGSDAGRSDADGSDADSGGGDGADEAAEGSGGASGGDAGVQAGSEADADAEELSGDEPGGADEAVEGLDGASGGDAGVRAGSEADADAEELSGDEPGGADEAVEGLDGASGGDAGARAGSDADEVEPSGDDEAAEAGPEAGAEAGGGDADPRVRGAVAPTRAAPAARLPAVGAGEEADSEEDVETQDDAEPEAAQEPDAEPKAATAPGSAVGTEPKTATAPGSAADKGPGEEGESAPASASADVRPGAADDGTDPRSADGTHPRSADAADPRSALDARPGAAVDAAGPGFAVDARAGAVDESASGTGGGSDVGDPVVDDGPEVADDEPEAADGEDVPQGPPAGDDESRTGGAGGESGGDGGAEADRPVDQPTAIFRAPRPPAVDQPTTMLKLGGGAAKPAEDAEGDEGDDADAAPPVERTSKFVALKSLDEPTAPKPPEGPAALSPAEATRAIPQVGPERTTQQPLPPKPPLDLLAELTNTPPPRQTPVRTVIRRVKIWTPLAILLAIVFAVVQAVRPLPTPTLALTTDASYAFEGEKVSLPWPGEGQGWMDVNGIGTVDSFGEQKPVAIGSVAKAMTAYVILKEHPMKVGSKGATIPVDAKAETEGGYDEDGKGESTLNTVKEGDKLTQYDAIAAIMIPSANNIARLLARWDSNGSEEEFVKKMNAAAKDLGMTNTTYTDPSGLKETTVSTAEDQVKLGNALVQMKALTDITKLPEWTDPSGLKHRNYNTLVPYDNAIGIKTGSTTAAGGNLLFAATKEVGGETVIVVGAILGQHTPPIIDTVNAVSKTAMVAAQDALTSSTILKKGDVVGYVDDGLGGQTPVVVTKDVSAVGWAGKTVKLELDPSESIPNEAKTGTEVGSLTVGDGSGDGVVVPVALQKDLTEPGFGTRLTRVS